MLAFLRLRPLRRSGGFEALFYVLCNTDYGTTCLDRKRRRAMELTARSIVTFLSGFGGSYLGAYLRRKAENLAMHRDIGKLVEQMSAVTAGKKLERLRAFFRFAHDRQWVESNPAARIKPPKASVCPTMPLTPEQWLDVLTACDKFLAKAPPEGKLNALRL